MARCLRCFHAVAASLLLLLIFPSPPNANVFAQHGGGQGNAPPAVGNDDGVGAEKQCTLLPPPPRPPALLLSALAWLDSALDTLQGGRSYNDRASHPLFRMSPNWFPLTRDEIKGDRAVPLDLVEGKLPEDLDGVALRIGPNADPDVGFNKRLNAIIDGDGMLHSIRLDGKTGRALYTSGWIDTPRRRFESEHLGGRAFFLQLGEMRGLVGFLKALLTPLKVRAFGRPDVYLGQANTALVTFDGAVHALKEDALPFELDLKEDGTFESVGYQTFGGRLDYPFSAHPRVDPETGEMFFHGYSAFVEPPLRWGSVSPSSSSAGGAAAATVTRYVDVESPSGGTPFSHDFAITENYVLLLDSSVRFDLKNALRGEALKLDGSSPLRFGICRRNSTSADDIMWYEHEDAAALLHFVNAWEEGEDRLILWAPLWKKFVGDVAAMTDKPADIIRMTEFSFDLKDPQRRIAIRDVEDGARHPTAVDFPVVNANFVGRKAECAYAGIMARYVVDFDGISKWRLGGSGATADVEGGGLVKNVLYGDGITGGEPIVAPKVGRGEDDSCAVYVMSLIYDANTSLSYLVIYDGEDFGDEPVAKYAMPHRVPHGLHASWVNANVLSPTAS